MDIWQCDRIRQGAARGLTVALALAAAAMIPGRGAEGQGPASGLLTWEASALHEDPILAERAARQDALARAVRDLDQAPSALCVLAARIARSSPPRPDLTRVRRHAAVSMEAMPVHRYDGRDWQRRRCRVVGNAVAIRADVRKESAALLAWTAALLCLVACVPPLAVNLGLRLDLALRGRCPTTCLAAALAAGLVTDIGLWVAACWWWTQMM